MACDRCHSVGSVASPDNEVLLVITHGFGSERYLYDACDITQPDARCEPGAATTTHRLDAIQTKEGEPLVVVGHEGEHVSRPLTLEEIQRMRRVLVPDGVPLMTDIPEDAATDPFWPKAVFLR